MADVSFGEMLGAIERERIRWERLEAALRHMKELEGAAAVNERRVRESEQALRVLGEKVAIAQAAATEAANRATQAQADADRTATAARGSAKEVCVREAQRAETAIQQADEQIAAATASAQSTRQALEQDSATLRETLRDSIQVLQREESAWKEKVQAARAEWDALRGRMAQV